MGDDGGGGGQQNVVQQQTVTTQVAQSTNVIVENDPLVGINTGRIADSLSGLSKLTSYSFQLGLLDFQARLARERAISDLALLRKSRDTKLQANVNRYIFDPFKMVF